MAKHYIAIALFVIIAGVFIYGWCRAIKILEENENNKDEPYE